MPQREVYIAIILATLILLSVAFFLVIFVLYFLKIKRQISFEKELMKKEINETVIKSQLEIQEQTLQHISRELHDNLGQIASLIKINLNTIHLADTDNARRKVEDTKALTRQLIGDIKLLSTSLNSDRITYMGLGKMLQALAEQLDKTGQYSAVYEETGNAPLLPNDTLIILYRMVQEVVNNIIKHSNARHIAISLTTTEKNITLAISDDGIGFEPSSHAAVKQGNGLGNLRVRSRHINAVLAVESKLGAGCKITICLPI